MALNKTLPIIALAVASAALLTTLLMGTGNLHSKSAETGHDTDNTLANRFEMLQQEHQALKESNRELLQKVAQLERADATSKGGSMELARLKQQLDELAARQALLSAFNQDFDAHVGNAVKQAEAAAQAKELAEAYAVAMDPSQKPEARVKRAHQLKRSGQFDDRAARAMADLYRQTDQGHLEQRLLVLDALRGVAPLELRDSILLDLKQEVQTEDQSGLSLKFRHTAIGALESMLPDPSVRDWLIYLAQNDPNPDVAAHAGELLGLPPPSDENGN